MILFLAEKNIDFLARTKIYFLAKNKILFLAEKNIVFLPGKVDSCMAGIVGAVSPRNLVNPFMRVTN